MTQSGTPLPEGKWTEEPSSLVDPVGRVLHYEGRLLRGIRKPYADDVATLLTLAERHRWFDRGLIATWRTDFATEEFPLIVEHQPIPFVTLRGEWSAEGLRRAAISYLELSTVLAQSGYCLKDAHPWNVLFDGTTPRITDFGSIRPIAEFNQPAWMKEFHKYFLSPLLLFARGQNELARALLREHLVGVGLWLIDHAPELLLPHDLAVLPQEPNDAQQTFAKLHALVSGLVFSHAPTEWTTYPQPPSTAKEPQLREKDRIVRMLLDRIDFRTAIDLGAHRGLHASMCAEKSAAVIACDIDETCLDDMFLRSTKLGDRILPLYLNVVSPISASGAFLTIAPATERLQCDVAIALALVHHVCVRWQFSPEAFARIVAAFTRQAAIIEFIPSDDWHVAQWGLPTPPGYSTDGMQGALCRLFRRVERFETGLEPRVLFLCREKR